MKFEAKFPGSVEPLWSFHSAQVFEYDDVTAMLCRKFDNFMASGSNGTSAEVGRKLVKTFVKLFVFWKRV